MEHSGERELLFPSYAHGNKDYDAEKSCWASTSILDIYVSNLYSIVDSSYTG